MGEWKEPTDFCLKTVLWEKTREESRNMRNEHYSQFLSKNPEKPEGFCRTSRENFLLKEKKQEEFEKKLQNELLARVSAKQQKIFAKSGKVSCENQKKKAEIQRIYQEKLRKKLVLQRKLVQEEEKKLLEDKKTFSCSLKTKEIAEERRKKLEEKAKNRREFERKQQEIKKEELFSLKNKGSRLKLLQKLKQSSENSENRDKTAKITRKPSLKEENIEKISENYGKFLVF